MIWHSVRVRMNNLRIIPTEPRNSIKLTVRSLRAMNEGAEIAVTVALQSGDQSETRVLRLLTEQYCELKVEKGEISEEKFEELEHAAELCGAIRCGENLLAYGANSLQMLSKKIMRHGYTGEVALCAAEYLRDRGLINENEDMRREIEKCLRKLWGERRIRSHLWDRGFDRQTLESVEDVLTEVDFSELCAKLIRKHYGGLPQSTEETRKMTAGLYRYGYKPEEIRRAMRILNGES